MTDDDQAFADWYEGSREKLVRAVAVAAGSPDLAADAVADAFVRAYERWSRVSRMDNRDGWVFRVAVNRAYRQLGRSQRRRVLYRMGPNDIEMSGEQQSDVWVCVRSPPKRQREVVALRYICDMTESGIALYLGLSEGAVSASLVKARKTLCVRATDRPGLPMGAGELG